jgi:DNA-binding GntR family transcriptional regulator
MRQIVPTASSTIVDRIRDDIVAGHLAFGSRLTLDALAARYDVGHMPIREALRQLQGEGVLVLTPNRGARVRGVHADIVRNIFDMRIAIEAMLARRAARAIDARGIARLEAIEDEFEAKARTKDFRALLALNRQFHSVINDAAQNPEAEAVLDRHRRLIAALWMLHGYGDDRPAGVISDHRHIIAALAAHDADVAAALAMAHAAKAKQELIARMTASNPVAASVAA